MVLSPMRLCLAKSVSSANEIFDDLWRKVMKQLLLAALTLAAMSSAAFAQPLTLAESQLDEVTAGLTVNTTAFYSLATTPNNSVTTDFIIQSVEAP
jgi:hypothetical protein